MALIPLNLQERRENARGVKRGHDKREQNKTE
jgi:hypothetical protein